MKACKCTHLRCLFADISHEVVWQTHKVRNGCSWNKVKTIISLMMGVKNLRKYIE